MRRLGRVATGLLALANCAAQADTLPALTEARSASLGRALQDWTAAIGAPVERFETLAGEGHYDLNATLGLDEASGLSFDGEPIAARVTGLADGRWQFDSVALPSPLRIARQGRLETTSLADAQTAHAVIDPTLKTASESTVTRLGLFERREQAKGASITTTARSALHETWQPASPGRADIVAVTQAEDTVERSDGHVPAAGELSIRTETDTIEADDADPERIATLRLLLPTILFGDSDPATGQTAAQKAALHRLLDTTRDIAATVRYAITADRVASYAPGRNVLVDRVAMSSSLAATDGRLNGRLGLEVAGFYEIGPSRDIDSLGVLPRAFALQASVSGLAVEDAYAMAELAVERPGSLRGELTKHAVDLAIDTLTFDLGPAVVSATASIHLDRPGLAHTIATVSATGLDSLIRQTSGKHAQNKALLAALIFLKGLGERDGDTVVWQIRWERGQVRVNDTDFSHDQLFPLR